MNHRFLIIFTFVILSAYAVTMINQEGSGEEEKWFLLNLHQHIWDGEEWGRDRVNYTIVFDLMFNGSYFDFDGVLINDQLPKKDELKAYSDYVTEKYPGKLYLVGGHYHIYWRGEELSISIIMPRENASSLPDDFYECEEITNLTLEEIASAVHSAGGLLIWDHPFAALTSLNNEEIDTLMNLFDGIELVSVRGMRGAGSLAREELDMFWDKVEPYVADGKIFPAAVTDYSAYLGIPEKRGAFWVNKNYGTLIKSPSLDEESIIEAFRKKNTVALLQTKDGDLIVYGKPVLAEEVKERLYRGTLR